MIPNTYLPMMSAGRAQPERSAPRPSIADGIYRPFFLAGIIIVLSVGCLWGSVNLLLMGLRRSFGGVDYSWVLAHGHAMVFGFVGLFIMGFAYQVFPGFKHTTMGRISYAAGRLWKPRLAVSALPLMAVGIGLQAFAHLLAPRWLFLRLGVAAGLLQFAAVVIFAFVVIRTWGKSPIPLEEWGKSPIPLEEWGKSPIPLEDVGQRKKPGHYDGFIYAALGWYILAAMGNPLTFWLFETAEDMRQFLFRVATFNIPYRDIQLFGMAVVMILGVSLRYLPDTYGLRMPSDKWRGFLLWGTNGSIAAGIVLFLASRLSGNYWLAIVQQGAAIVLFIAAVGTPWQYGLLSAVPDRERDRGLKFIRAAYIWFIIATAMLVLVPIYNFGVYRRVTGSSVPFSHAFFGGYRHALTVGFITMMIIGVSSRLVPVLAGMEVRRFVADAKYNADSLWPTFLLLNVGNALRIVTEIGTDFTPAAYPLTGMTGFIEVFALALWGYELVKNMLARAHLRDATISGDPT